MANCKRWCSFQQIEGRMMKKCVYYLNRYNDGYSRLHNILIDIGKRTRMKRRNLFEFILFQCHNHRLNHSRNRSVWSVDRCHVVHMPSTSYFWKAINVFSMRQITWSSCSSKGSYIAFECDCFTRSKYRSVTEQFSVVPIILSRMNRFFK